MKETTPLRLSTLLSGWWAFWIILLGLSGSAVAQNRPVTTTLQLTPPYSVYLADYARPGSEQMQVYLLLRDLSEAQYDVRLRLTIEGSGIRLQTDPNYLPPPITLEGGSPTIVSGQELAPYLDSRNLIFSGITQGEYEQRRALPEGFYQFSVEVIDYRRADRSLSRPATFMAWFTLNEPPRITAPLCGSALPLQEPTNILFQWLSGGNVLPGSALATEYELTLVEVFSADRNVDDAIRSSIPLLQTTTTETSYLYGVTDAALIPGQKYAFRVRAVDTEGRGIFKNDGYSEVCSFTYGDGLVVTPPDGIQVYAENARRALVNWHLAIDPDAYRVEYRCQADRDQQDDADERDEAALSWFSVETTEEQVVLRDLEPETTYEVRVASLFSSYVSRYSNIQTFTTPEVMVAACGSAPASPITASTAPLTTAMAGQYWQVGDFEMQVRAVRGGDGVFSGWGVMSVPYLGLQIPVKFDQIWVDEDYNLVKGEVTALSEGLEGFQERWQQENPEGDEEAEGGDDSRPVADEEGDTENGPGNQEVSTVTVEGEVVRVFVNEQGEVVAIDDEGNEEVVAEQVPEEGEASAVEDSQGNSFTVDSEGSVSSGNASAGDPANNRAVDVEQELIKEVLDHFKEEINTFLENKDKGPLDEAVVKRMMDLPDCLFGEEAQLEHVLAQIDYFIEHREELIALIAQDEADKARFDFLVSKLRGKQPPFREGLTEAEWDELIAIVCPYLVSEVIVEGLDRDSDIVSFNSMPIQYKLKDGRLEFTYSVIDTLSLNYNKLEIFKLEGEDTVLVDVYTNIAKGKEINFIDEKDQDSAGWSGKVPNGNYVRAGNYLFSITVTTDSEYTNGFKDVKALLVQPFDISIADDIDFFGYDTSDPAGCFRRASEMLGSDDYQTVASDHPNIVQMTRADSSDNLQVQDDILDGIDLINEYLDDGIPIMVGVDYHDGHPGNIDETTDHWLVIVGRTTTNDQTCYRYYDAQTGHVSIGTSSDNILCEQNDHTLTGVYREGSVYERTYTVTMVRPSEQIDD